VSDSPSSLPEGGVEALRQLVEELRAREQQLCRQMIGQGPTEYAERLGFKADGVRECADRAEALLSTLARSPQSTTEEKEAGLQRYSRPSGTAEPEASPLQPANAIGPRTGSYPLGWKDDGF
jgi:hypothetical protein